MVTIFNAQRAPENTKRVNNVNKKFKIAKKLQVNMWKMIIMVNIQ